MHDTKNSKPVDAVPDSSRDAGAVSVDHSYGLDSRYTLNAFSCGCLIRSEFVNGSGQKWISYCAKHAAAPEMYAALKGLLGVVNSVEQAVYSNGEVYAAERALAKAEGRA